MSEQYLRLVVPDALVSEIQQLAATHNIQISSPQPCDSTAEGLNAPLTGAEIIEIARVITVAAGAGTAVATFWLKVVEILNAHRARAVVTTRDASRRLNIDGTTRPSQITEF